MSQRIIECVRRLVAHDPDWVGLLKREQLVRAGVWVYRLNEEEAQLFADFAITLGLSSEDEQPSQTVIIDIRYLT